MTTTRPASAPAAPVDIAPATPSALRHDGADAARIAAEYFRKHIDAE